MNPAIVVPAYNRPQALNRLLCALKKAKYPRDSELILHISIDRGESEHDQGVLRVAEEFDWEFGEKRVSLQEEHLGLVEHFYYCGSLASEYGSIILLEDDLLASPMYYSYASQALKYYGGDPRIAGISLYSLWFNGYTHYPFTPLPDESDIFFLQVPYTQGQAFTKVQWDLFINWLNASDRRLSSSDPIHEMFLNFDEEDWFPLRTKYLIDTDRFYVFPRESLATGMGDEGTHFAQPSDFFQVPLQDFKEDFRWKDYDQSVAVYDSFYELVPERFNRLTEAFHGFSYAVDLHGTKSLNNLRCEYVLTSKPCKAPIITFGKAMRPIEANVINNFPGNEIAFCRKKDLDLGWLSLLRMKKSNHEYFTRGNQFGKRMRLGFALLNALKKLHIWQD
jgi:hypothetical protein